MPSRDDIAKLSLEIERALLEAQRKEKPKRGQVKCPLCGAVLQATKNGRIRVHAESPTSVERCPASGKSLRNVGALRANTESAEGRPDRTP